MASGSRIPGLADADAGAGALWLAAAPHLRSVWLDDADGLGWAGSVEDLLARADRIGCGDGPDNALLAAVEREVTPGDDAFRVTGATGPAVGRGHTA